MNLNEENLTKTMKTTFYEVIKVLLDNIKNYDDVIVYRKIGTKDIIIQYESYDHEPIININSPLKEKRKEIQRKS